MISSYFFSIYGNGKTTKTQFSRKQIVKFGEECNSFIPAVVFRIDNHESWGFTGINLVVSWNKQKGLNVTTTARYRFNSTNSMHTFYLLHVYHITTTCFGVSHTIFRKNLTTTVQKQCASDVSCHATYEENMDRGQKRINIMRLKCIICLC